MATLPADHRRPRPVKATAGLVPALALVLALLSAACSGGGDDADDQVATGDSVDTADAGEGGSLDGLDAGRAIDDLLPEETTASTDTTAPPETAPTTASTAPPQTVPPQTSPPVTIGTPPTVSAGVQPSPVDPSSLSPDEQTVYSAVVGYRGGITPEAELVNKARSMAQSGQTQDPNILGNLTVNWSYVNQAFQEGSGGVSVADLASSPQLLGQTSGDYSHIGIGVAGTGGSYRVVVIVAR
ncbi:MAG: hypothetical protein MUF83_05560 [Acidimicrobiales bacterium]|jgi:hypothetical protein|nr:hypothetical protein [Acidimicrobiales bacterium]